MASNFPTAYIRVASQTYNIFKRISRSTVLNCKSYIKIELIIFSTEKCNDFTYFHFRNEKTCFLLQKCDDKRPLCHVRGSCVSGGHCRSVIVYFGFKKIVPYAFFALSLCLMIKCTASQRFCSQSSFQL